MLTQGCLLRRKHKNIKGVQSAIVFAEILALTGISCSELGRMLSVHPSTFTRIRNGERVPSCDLAKAISDTLKLPADLVVRWRTAVASSRPGAESLGRELGEERSKVGSLLVDIDALRVEGEKAAARAREAEARIVHAESIIRDLLDDSDKLRALLVDACSRLKQTNPDAAAEIAIATLPHISASAARFGSYRRFVQGPANENT